MSNAVGNSLTRERIQQLLAVVGTKSREDDKQNVDAGEYNWRQSHYFSRDQFKKINDFAAKLAQKCSEKFTQLYRSDFNVTITSAAQHFAGELVTANNPGDYYLAFGTKDQTFGLIDIPGPTAILWPTQLLGDSKSAGNSERDLSQLEQSLLFDIVCGIIKAVSDSYDGSYDLRPVGEIVKGAMPIEIDGAKEICKISVSVKKSDSENSSEACFLIFCDKLQTIAGQKVQANDNPAVQNSTKAMFGHLQHMPVPVTARLANSMFNFREIMNLQVDDVLLLDKKVNEPAELMVEGKTIFRGRLAKSDNRYALLITELCNKK